MRAERAHSTTAHQRPSHLSTILLQRPSQKAVVQEGKEGMREGEKERRRTIESKQQQQPQTLPSSARRYTPGVSGEGRARRFGGRLIGRWTPVPDAHTHTQHHQQAYMQSKRGMNGQDQWEEREKQERREGRVGLQRGSDERPKQDQRRESRA